MSKAKAAAGDGAAVKSEGPLILLVDDFQDNREMYAEFLQFHGYRTAEAADGHEALDKAFSLLPSLVVMDLSLPGMDGWEATRRLKKDDRTRRIPVIALTGHALAGHSKVAFEAGCDSFVTKPCLPEVLLREVARMLDGHEKNEKSDKHDKNDKQEKSKQKSKTGR